MNLALSIKDVSYHYRHQWTGKRIPALQNLSLEVNKGEFFGFLGHNGAGKTTTIKCILCLIKPTGGEILIDGIPHQESRARERVGYVPEQPYFYDHLTVGETMELYTTLSGVPRARCNDAVRAALERVRLSSRSKSPLRSLSKGLTQRLALAQAIVANPSLLIVDEPFSGLDPIGRREFREIFADLHREGTTIFISSHALGDIEALCDRVSIMAHGVLKGVFPLKERKEDARRFFSLTLRCQSHLPFSPPPAVRRESLQDKVTLVYDDEAHALQALQGALAARLPILSYAEERERLEDLFIELVRFREEGSAE